MRICIRLALTTLLLAAMVLPALASGEPVDLPSGETVMLMHPGLDGVEAPWAVRSRLVAPEYPDQAGRQPDGNSVTLAVLVLADGSVAQIEVLGARHPNLGYEETARDAVSRWEFRPARRNDVAVHSYLIYSIEFPRRIEGMGEAAQFIAGQRAGGGAMTGMLFGNGIVVSGGGGGVGSANRGRVQIASRPSYVTGKLTNKNNSGKNIGTTDWAAKNGR